MKREPYKVLAHSLVAGISALPNDTWTCEDVYNLFAAVVTPKNKVDLAHAFYCMDSKYRMFGLYEQWHPKLRSTRNHPDWGPKVFGLWA